MGKRGPFRNRLCLVTDIESYSTHTTPQQGDAQQRLLQITQFALARAQVFRVARQERQDRGDGQLLLLPPRLDQTRAIPELVRGLRHALYLSNQEPGAFGRIRMRAAIARGAIAQGSTGFKGQPPTVACRLVDSQQLKDALKNHQEADLAFIAPDDLYQDVIKQDFPGLPSGEFTSTVISVKEYTGNAWIYVPASGPAVGADDATALWGAVAASVVVAGLMSAAPSGRSTWPSGLGSAGNDGQSGNTGDTFSDSESDIALDDAFDYGDHEHEIDYGDHEQEIQADQAVDSDVPDLDEHDIDDGPGGMIS